MRTPTELDFARLAAIIDCEGHIAINTGKTHRTHILQVTVGNRDRRLLEWCLAHFGGFICSNVYEKTNPRNAEVRRWRITGPTASGAIQRCLPYLIIKREQAEIVMEFRATFDRSGRLTESILAAREDCMRRLQSFTRKGPKEESITPADAHESGREAPTQGPGLFDLEAAQR